MDLVFGPVPSRRLGRSLGINSIPPKVCSYGCSYCQVGATGVPEIAPRPFFEPDEIFEAVAGRIRSVSADGGHIDYVTFVPDGEPTLDSRLGETIDLLKPLGIPVAVITNGSLLWRAEVRLALGGADWVSVKVDAADQVTWRRVNAPRRSLGFEQVREGMGVFADTFGGTLATESMLLAGINDGAGSVEGIAAFVARLGPETAYVAVPIRPPRRSGVRPPDEASLNRAYQIFAARVPHVELLLGYEGDAFASTGDLRTDLLSITAVHPLRRSAVARLTERCGASPEDVELLVAEGAVAWVGYLGEDFLVRRPHEVLGA